MKIVFNKQKMANTIAPIMCCVAGKSGPKAAEGILMEAKAPDTLILTTFDLQKGMRVTTNVEVIEEGCYVIDALKFKQTLNVMESETLTMTIDDKCHATIEVGKTVHQMNALKGSDFPEIPLLENVNNFKMYQRELREMISKVSYAMGVNDQRDILNGCYFLFSDESGIAVACDSFRLAKCEKFADFEYTGSSIVRHINFAFILPNKTIAELLHLLNDEGDEKVKIIYHPKTIVFEFEDLIFFSKVVEGRYIDYNRVLVKNHNIFMEINKEKILSALEVACLITEERIIGVNRANVKLDLSGGLLKITANSPTGSTYDEFEVKHEGDDIFIAFNNKYLIDCIRECGGENIRIGFSSPYSSISIEPVEKVDDTIEDYMILPVKMYN